MESKGDKQLAFLDLEISKKTKKIQNIGILLDSFGGRQISQEQISLQALKQIFATHKIDFICGHNFVEFDKTYLSNSPLNPFIQKIPILDTLYLSLLLFPDKPTHKLDKPYKQQLHRETPSNSPLQDCKSTKNLFYYLRECFKNLPQNMQDIFTLLLQEEEHFRGFFLYCATNRTQASQNLNSLESLIKKEFGFERESYKDFLDTPLEFAFVLSFINMLKIKQARYFSPYILRNYPCVVRILKHLRSEMRGIENLQDFAKNEFCISDFRTFQRMQSQNLLDNHNASKISQKDIIQSALDGKSFLAILPTGGGKTFTFQLPALIKARQYKSLTVVISPLQALMQNHIESFKAKNQNFCIEAISGFLNPIERFSVFEKLINGTVDILYLAPEALRSQSIFKALQKRHIERFVIDEAHCFSMWGHNFRQDYHYIAQTIKDLESSPHQKVAGKIAISCFTATAKPEVIEDIKAYFANELNISLKDFIASSERKSLSYEVVRVENEREKQEALWQILLSREQQKPKNMPNPTIIYIPQNAGLCKKLWIWLKQKCEKFGLNLVIEPFYAKLDDDVAEGRKEGRKKGEILQAFMDNEVDIIIATTAFGMGIDKPDITTIIHYELSDSLESYIQESGRGARDEERYKAKCFILYDKKDIDKNFAQLRRSNLDFGEIKSLVRVLKNTQKAQKRNPIYVSLKNLHKKLGKDEEDYEPTRIKTALLELEKAGIIERKRTKTQIYATSFRLQNSKDKEGRDKMSLAHQSLDAKKEAIQVKREDKRTFDEKAFLALYEVMILIVQNIIQRSRENSVVSLDELSDIVGSIQESQMVQALKILEKEGLLSRQDDIALFVDFKKAKEKMEGFFAFEKVLFEALKESIKSGGAFDLRECNDEMLKDLQQMLAISKNPLYLPKSIITSWGYLLKLAQLPFKCYFKNSLCVFAPFSDIDRVSNILQSRQRVVQSILTYIATNYATHNKSEFYLPSATLYDDTNAKEAISLNGFHFVLNNISEILDRDFDIRGGRLIYHSKECLEFDLEKLSQNAPYKREHFNASFKVFMEQKVANIHILQAFLDNFLSKGQNSAKSFMQKYFSLPKWEFLKEYKIDEKCIKSPISKDLLDKIIVDLNEEQRNILNDKSPAIMIYAGPGSGKTKTLVHKMAHLLTKEDKKRENFLMLAHSRVAVREFRDRLYRLLGEQALGVKILTFHSFALKLLAHKIKRDSELDSAIAQATKALQNDEISLPYTEVLMLDEYQDINAKHYEFIKAIFNQMSGQRQIVAVGDDDQLIMEFNGANKRFIQDFAKDFTSDFSSDSKQDIVEHLEDYFGEDFEFSDDEANKGFSRHSLTINYRSASKIIDFINAFREEFLPDSLKRENLLPAPSNKNKDFISFTLHKAHNSDIYDVCAQNLSLQAIARHINEVLTNNANSSIVLLLRSNEEVLSAQYELEKLGIKTARLLERDKFEAGNLVELWEFLELLKKGIDKEAAQAKICHKYAKSSNLNLFKRALALFEKEYEEDLTFLKQEKNTDLEHSVFASDFEEFLSELKFEEIEREKAQVIIATMHKAKGKEFDIVFVGIGADVSFSDSEKRLLYVAFSRAKEQLHIHALLSEAEDLLSLKARVDECKIYKNSDKPSSKIRYEMGLKDIFLSYSLAQYNLNNLELVAGEKVEILQNGEDNIELIYRGKCVGRLSKKFRDILLNKIQFGYKLESQAQVTYLIKWRDKKCDKITTQVLCEIILQRV